MEKGTNPGSILDPDDTSYAPGPTRPSEDGADFDISLSTLDKNCVVIENNKLDNY